MPIHFIPNDPRAHQGPPLRRKQPHAERAAGTAGFSYGPKPQAGLYQVGTADFLFWQSREAALAAVRTYEDLQGRKVKRWARSNPRSRLEILPDEGNELNAYYDGQSLRFYHFTTGAKTTWSGASTDVVAHETGHALLDQARPDLWGSNFPETNAFHESFGDCIALLTALDDGETREMLRKSIRRRNFVETWGEDLADGVRRDRGPQHGSARPRYARNTFGWALPTTLPSSGPPNVLAGESHSFSRVFTGCFYDTLLNILDDAVGAGKTPGAADIRQAARTVGSLLVRAAAEAPETARFFQSVGRTMVLIDEARNGGAHRLAIRQAFERHKIALGSAAMLAPTAALPGAAPVFRRGARPRVASAVLSDLRERLAAEPGARMLVRATAIAGRQVVKATHLREVSLGDIDSKLKGVVAVVPEPVLVGSASPTAAILGELPESTATIHEVKSFVQTLLETNRIAFDRQSVRTGIKGATAGDTRLRLPTHTVREVGKQKRLQRVRFACGG
jgi:hypothetical protein